MASVMPLWTSTIRARSWISLSWLVDAVGTTARLELPQAAQRSRVGRSFRIPLTLQGIVGESTLRRVDLRSLPSVDEVLARPAVRALVERHGRAAAKAGVRA